MTDPDNLLTPDQVAARLGLARETVVRMARQGRLPSVAISKRVLRFDQSALQAWVKGKATGTNEAFRSVQDE